MIAAIEKGAAVNNTLPTQRKYGLSITFSLEDFPHDVLMNPALHDYTFSKDTNILIMKLSEAIRIEEFKVQFAHTLDKHQEKSFFSSFHDAQVTDPVCIIIPDNYTANKPVIINIEQEKSCSLGSIFIFVGKNSAVTFIEEDKSKLSSKNYSSHFIKIIGDKYSRITYITVQDKEATSYAHTTRQASLSNHAILQWIDCHFGGAVNMIETTSNLDGEGSKVETNSLFVGDNTQRFDILVQAIHLAQNTSSNLVSRAALNDAAKAIYRGLIRVEPTAPKSNGYQKADMLLLGKDAQADPIPELEIKNDDVTCTHSATVGRVNTEDLFYLMSRGLNREEATRALVEGFFIPIINNINIPEIREHIIHMIDNKYTKKHEIGTISV